MENNIISTKTNMMEEAHFEQLYLVFVTANKYYAINSNNVVELIDIPKLDFIKKTPHAIAGLLNYKDERIKVVDFRVVVGEKAEPFTTENQVVILEHKSNTVAFLVDKIIDIFSISDKQIQNLPYKQAASIIKNVFQHNDKMISILDLNSIEQYLDFTSGSIGELDYESYFPKDEHSVSVLEQRSLALSNQTKAIYDIDSQKLDQYLFFKLANLNYCLNIKHIKELITKSHVRISPLPNTPTFIKGIINLRGEFITIIDLYYLLNKKSSIEASSQKLIVIDSKEYEIAFIVDEILYISAIENSKIYIHDGHNSNRHIQAEFYQDNQLYSILNLEKILSDKQLLINVS